MVVDGSGCKWLLMGVDISGCQCEWRSVVVDGSGGQWLLISVVVWLLMGVDVSGRQSLLSLWTWYVPL